MHISPRQVLVKAYGMKITIAFDPARSARLRFWPV